MPPGQRRIRNGDGVEANSRRIHRFLEPCLLLLVHCNEIHGYELAEALNPFGFEHAPADVSTIYRLLRDLEDRGLVGSRWDTSNTGAARRVYHTTEEGNRYLAWWVDDLRETDRVLHDFLHTYDEHMETHH